MSTSIQVKLSRSNGIAGAELQEQVAHLKTEYSAVGDQLEQEQSRAQQVTLMFSLHGVVERPSLPF